MWSFAALIGAATLSFALAILRTIPCMSNGWASPDRQEALCYSDIPVLYVLRGMADGLIPYLQWPADGHPVEYPVLTGLFMLVGSLLTAALTGGGGDPLVFYLVTMLISFACFLVAVVAVALTVPGRFWDGLLLALAPAAILASTINWDLLVIALTAVAMALLIRQRPVLGGVFLGLAIAAKFYPLLILGPLLVLAWRERRLADAGRTILATVLTWFVVNLPVALANFEGWSYFFTFSADRGQDFGSPWIALSILGYGVPAETLNLLGALLLVGACAGIAVLILVAKAPPRLAQVAFLVVAAFLLLNKVYSPQFVLWLLPLAVLARPRWRDLLIWQAGEAIYFVAVWYYLIEISDGQGGLDERWYAAAIFIHMLATLYLVAVVVRDILLPRFDPVRTDPERVAQWSVQSDDAVETGRGVPDPAGQR